MTEADWKTFLRELSIRVMAVPFSPGLKEAERQAIADHMIGVNDAITAMPFPGDQAGCFGKHR